jgi:GGDEF domain-containing protein
MDTVESAAEPAVRNGSNPALDAYVFAIGAIAHYAPDLEPELTEPHRRYLRELADRSACGGEAYLDESRATLRGLLRDYRDKASQYLNVLREDLSAAALALAEILESLGSNDGEKGDQLREAMRILLEPPGDDCETIRENVYTAAKTVEACIAAVRKQHQLAVSQFMIEIRMLHKRIDALESAASVDMLTRLFPRQELETRIREGRGMCRLLLVLANGVLNTVADYGNAVAEELIGALIRRMRNALPPGTVVARWNSQAFVAMLDVDAIEAKRLAERITANLSGPYACMKDGRAVHPPVDPQVLLLEQNCSGADDTLQRVEEFFAREEGARS